MLKAITLPYLAAVLLIGGLAACDIEQTEEGEMPEVDIKENGEVDIKTGKMPEYDVNPSDEGTDADAPKEDKPTNQ